MSFGSPGQTAQTAAGAGTGTTLASVALGIVGDIFGAKSASTMYNYQSAVSYQNAALNRQNATFASLGGEVEAQEAGLRTAAQVGATKAGYGAGNISTASGSPSRVVGSEIAIGQENAGVIRSNAAQKAFGYQVAAASDVSQAQLESSAANAANQALPYQIAGTIIGGAGQVSSEWMQAAKAGVGSQTYTG